MKLKDRQTIFDLVLMTFGDLAGLANVVANNDDLFAQDANFNIEGEVINQNVVDYFVKDVLTY